MYTCGEKMKNKLQLIIVFSAYLVISIFYWFISGDIVNDSLKWGRVDDIFLILSIIVSVIVYLYKGGLIWKK